MSEGESTTPSRLARLEHQVSVNSAAIERIESNTRQLVDIFNTTAATVKFFQWLYEIGKWLLKISAVGGLAVYIASSVKHYFITGRWLP